MFRPPRDGDRSDHTDKRSKANERKLQASYKRLLNTTGQVVAQAKRIADEVNKDVKKSKNLVDQLRLDAFQAELERMTTLVQQVMRQTKARVFHNDLNVADKLVSLFETATQIIRKGIIEADGVRPIDKDPGSGKSNRHRLRSM